MSEVGRARRRQYALDALGIAVVVVCASFVVVGYTLGDHDGRETVRECPGFVGARLTLRSCDDRPTLGAVESPETSDYATIGTRQYKAIRITAPGYRCARDGDGWTCTRGAP